MQEVHAEAQMCGGSNVKSAPDSLRFPTSVSEHHDNTAAIGLTISNMQQSKLKSIWIPDDSRYTRSDTLYHIKSQPSNTEVPT